MARVLGASLVVVGTLLVGGSAVAQTEIREPDRIVYKPVTEIVFDEGATLEGDLDRAGGTLMMVAPRASFASMIPTRGNFLRELQRSTDDL